MLDYRAQALSEMSNVEVFRESPVTAEDILEYGFEHVAVTTGSSWRRDGVARWHTLPDDHYYMGGVLGELLSKRGLRRPPRDARTAGISVDR